MFPWVLISPMFPTRSFEYFMVSVLPCMTPRTFGIAVLLSPSPSVLVLYGGEVTMPSIVPEYEPCPRTPSSFSWAIFSVEAPVP